MKKIGLIGIMLILACSFIATTSYAADKVLFSFEDDLDGWEIPDWSFEQDGYVAEEVDIEEGVAQEGDSSLKVMVDFPGGRWNSAIVEVMEFFDWTPFSAIAVSIYLPENAPKGLKAKMVLTVGENWKWTEMSRSQRLKPGKWTTIKANLKPGSADWKRVKPTDEFRADIRKIAIRIESNKPAYKGPIYIDNVVLAE